MARTKQKAKEPIKIRFKKLSNGNQSIYLDYWSGENSTRQYEFLKLYLIPPTAPNAKELNEHALMVANTIKNERLKDLANGKAGIKNETSKGKILFSTFANVYIDNHKELAKKTLIVYKCVLVAMEKYNSKLKLCDIDKAQAKKIIEFLRNYNISEGTQSTYLTKIGRLLNVAQKEGFINKNPFVDIDAKEKPKLRTAKREFLEIEELKKLIETDCLHKETKRAFLFSCFCGLRLVDIKALKWEDVKTIDGKLCIEIVQQKTKERLIVPLSNKALEYLGTTTESGKIFKLGCDVWTEKKVKEWAQKAGICKRITFHSARHTFATMLITKGADLYTTSKLLGHTNIKTTQIYAEIVGKKKQQAVDLLNNLEL